MTKLYNRAKMTISSGGTGTITLGSASQGFMTFSDAGVQNGDVISYVIEDGSNVEFGTATYNSSGTTLSSRTVTKSYNGSTWGTSAITVSTNAIVFITPLAADLQPPATGGGLDKVFYENFTTVTASYEVASNSNALSTGPITINSGAVVTVPSASTWTVL